MAAYLSGVSASPDGAHLVADDPDGQLAFSHGPLGGRPCLFSLASFLEGGNTAGYYYGHSFGSELTPLAEGAIPAPGSAPCRSLDCPACSASTGADGIGHPLI